ncbi:hypothetical protein [Piscinibacter sp. HJYY11]|uniref:hypothetical protein n=1 Tax=Piscinibacter sp. HJYY11 TaxID=2801333 RepID=UPI00191CBD47|nr:hypothetical protein [Piscinibacter sp. HJYY11]MBL0730556.1 hypothetical protein [Piscinibacter sp. HJYY11]
MSVDALAVTLAASLTSGIPMFALIDPLLGEPIPLERGDVADMAALTKARERTWLRPVYCIELAASIPLPLHQHPYLVEMHGPDDPQLAETVEMAAEELSHSQLEGLRASGSAPHRIGGWLQSSLAAPELTRALSAMMRVNTHAITTARYQRLADRRVLSWLRQVVGDARVAGQLGRIQSWSYLDPCGHLASLCSSDVLAIPVRLTQSEWTEFMKGDLLHPAVARWLGERALRATSGDASALETTSCYLQANAALERAQAAARRWPHRFTRLSDHVTWAVLALLHPDIDRRADVAHLLNERPLTNEPVETVDDLSATLSAICQKVST